MNHTLLEVLEDRPNTFDEMGSDIRSRGFNPRIATTAAVFAQRLTPVPDDLCGWLIDNHLNKCNTLKDFGRPDIGTAGGSEAGFRIITDIMIPKIRDGQLPRRPLGLMSGQDVRRNESAFRNNFGAEWDNIYFVPKPKSDQTSQFRIKSFVGALEHVAGFDEEPDEATVQKVRASMLRQAYTSLGFDSKEVAQILRLKSDTKFLRELREGEIDLESRQWEEMAKVLFQIDVALSNVFQGNPDETALAREWLAHTHIGPKGQSARAMLLTGEFDAAYRVLEAASFLPESQRKSDG